MNQEEVIARYEKAIKLEPSNFQAHKSLGDIYLKKGDMEAAIASYQKALELTANSERKQAIIYRLLGLALRKKGNLTGASANFRKAIELAPKNAINYINLGETLDQFQRTNAAIANYKKARKLAPENAIIYSKLGNAWLKKGEEKKAIANYQKAIKLNPNQPAGVYKNLGDSLSKQERLDEAHAIYQKGIELKPDNAHLLYHSLGDTQVKQGNIEAAAASYHRALEIKPELNIVASKIATLVFNKAIPLLESGKIEEAIEYFQEIDRSGWQEEISTLWPTKDSIMWPQISLNLASTFAKLKPSGTQWPKITVVTPSFNQGDYIEETILSVLNQEYKNLEYIIVDGVSTDGTSLILARYKEQVSATIVEPDRGQSHAINKGFNLATGELITWLNSDDMLAPGALYMAALTYLKHNCDLVAGICISHEDKQIRTIKKPRVRQHDFTIETLTDLNHFWGSGHFFIQPEVIFSRSAWEKAGGKLDENLHYCMDYELWIRLAKIGARLKVISWPMAFYRKHHLQKTADNSIPKKEILKVRNQYCTIAPTPERSRSISNKLASLGESSLPRVLVVSKGSEFRFAERIHGELNKYFSKRNYKVSFCHNLHGVDVASFDAVILLVHLRGEVEIIKELSDRGFSGAIIAWLWKNHINPLKNAEVSDLVDICIPAHEFVGERLRNRHSILKGYVPQSTMEWTTIEAQRLWAIHGHKERDNRLFYGGFVQYESAQKHIHRLLPYQVVKLIDELKETMPECHFSFLDKASEDVYYGLTPQRRFAFWCSYKVSIFLTIDNGLWCRFFDALLCGQIPIVSAHIFDLDLLIPPSIQAALPVYKLQEYDVQSVRKIYQKASKRFDEEGMEGVARRHQFVTENHMFVHRIEAILNQLRFIIKK